MGGVMRLTIAEAAQRLRLSEQTVRRRIRSGELQATQMSGPGASVG
jgi:excisionase family DNA binding protein